MNDKKMKFFRIFTLFYVVVFMFTGVSFADTGVSDIKTTVVSSNLADKENGKVSVLSDKANIYIAKSSSQIIAQRVKDDELEVLSEDASWYEVKLNENVSGWIRKNDIVSDSKPPYTYKQTGKVIKQYSDDSIQVSIEEFNSRYHVTKIWVRDPANQVKKKEAGWGKSLKTVSSMLNSTSNAIVGCNGSGFYKAGSWTPSQSAIKATSWDKTTEGYLVISNGTIRRKISGQKTNALLGILPNGSFKYYENNQYSDVINDGVKNTFTFGPLLIKDGVKYTQKVGTPRKAYSGNPRHATLVGQIDENNFILITTIQQTALSDIRNFGLKMECQFLYNMDGGGSRTLWFRGSNIKGGSRAVGDALYFVTLKQE